MNDRLQQQLAFILEIDKLKQITRQSYLVDASRHETDSDHSWHLAMMAFLLKEHANEEVDVLHVIMMVLIHDLVEIDAGDTYAYDTAGNATKRAREEKAADRIFNLLPEDQAQLVRDLWEEFEARQTPEAKFANALDRIQPILLNDASGGLAWREHGVHSGQVLSRNAHTAEGSSTLWSYCEQLIAENVKTGNLKE
jgi:putative hydrolase of HD superfamily